MQKSILGNNVPSKSIRPPVFIQAESLNEIARLVCAMERTPLPLFAIKNGSQNMIATQLDLFAGVPVFYYSHSSEVKRFLGYRATQNGEEISLVNSPTNPVLIHAPIIDIVKLPPIFEKGLFDSLSHAKYEGPKFLSVKVKDLVALVQVASYKMLFEEPPLPIFAFPFADGEGRKKWKVGTFTRIEEYEEASIFFYLEQEEKIEQNFVRYSVGKAEASLTNRTDEHGYIFIKIIRLGESHPLIEP
jgi:hypothetical protein